MNSKSIYQSLIKSGKHLKEEWKPVGSGLERHHIVPRHQGGSDEESNYTYLTQREHTLAHYLLWRIHGHEGDRTAYRMMRCVQIYPTMLGKSHTEETKLKMRKPRSEETKLKMRKPKSEEHRRNISKGRTGIKFSDSHRANIKASRKNQVYTDEHRNKIGESSKGTKWWNNGERNSRSKECPGSEWKPGRLSWKSA